jgi:hypothetical protein
MMDTGDCKATVFRNTILGEENQPCNKMRDKAEALTAPAV